MAKAKKPASSGKTDTPDAAEGTSTKKTSDTPKSASASPSAPQKEIKETANAQSKAEPAASKAATAQSAAKSSNDPKASSKPDASKPDTGPKSDTSKPTESKEPNKSGGPTKATDQKAAVTSTKDEAAKEPAKSATSSAASAKSATAKPSEPAKASVAKRPEPVATAKAPEPSRSSFWPLAFGGILAAAFGFLAAEWNLLNLRPDFAAMQTQLDDQKKQIAAWVPADLSGVESGLAEVNSALETASAQIITLAEQAETLDARIVELELRPVAVVEDGTEIGPSPEFLAEMDALKASIEEQRQAIADQQQVVAAQKDQVAQQNDEIARLLENALNVEAATAQAAQEAAIQAATAKLTAAFSSGEPYAAVIDDLAEAGIDGLPEALTDPAADGVATLLMLQTDFPAAARASLAAARETGVDAGTGGVAGFLRRQLAARSVTPQEGGTPDAILSRAEASVRAGQVSGALEELEALPDGVTAAMQDWLGQARVRAAAEQAVQDLNDRLMAN